MLSSVANLQSDRPSSSATRSASDGRAVVVGLYGIPGSGKTFLLNQLKQVLRDTHFAFYEGSQMIAAVVPGGLVAFHGLKEPEKMLWRQRAIDAIEEDCAGSGRTAIVTGHFMFWSEEAESGRPVYTQRDLDTFTHIIYLDISAEVIGRRRLEDKGKSRPPTSTSLLDKWQQAEKEQLRHLCRNHRILFTRVSIPALLEKTVTLVRDFCQHSEAHNLSVAEDRLDEIFSASQCQLETVLVMDADRTLAPEDTGVLFWEKTSDTRRSKDDAPVLKTLFSSPLGYSYTAFRQATLLYEEVADDREFNILCQNVASAVHMHPEIISLLHVVAKQKHVGMVIVSCGLRLVWEKVLEREGLSEAVNVIGGGRLRDGFVVSASVKGALVARLRHTHKLFVWAFGDSLLDLEMLRNADQSIVVVGEERTRSKTMDVALSEAIDNHGFRARQVLLPSNASPRLDNTKLPLVCLTERGFIDSLVRRRRRRSGLQVRHATERNAAKILMTPTRDANYAGPVLREAHRRVGWYLATEFLTEVVGLEEYPVPHVQGYVVNGHRLSNEQQTLVVALMRGGEPMALGINDVFPLAMFLHASGPIDIKSHHLQGKRTIMLVDSVINSGKTVAEFVLRIRQLDATARIVVVAGVVQVESISEGNVFHGLDRETELSLVALRLSENKFTGKGGTDTGNRLFNSTNLL